MKSAMWVVIAGVLVAGAASAGDAEAGDKKKGGQGRRAEVRHERGVTVRYEQRDVRYVQARDVYVLREYYRPHYQPLPPGLRHRYYRTGRLPPGWARRMRPVPVYIEREMVAVPRGYRRGVIDGHVVIYNPGGTIIDVGVLF